MKIFVLFMLLLLKLILMQLQNKNKEAFVHSFVLFNFRMLLATKLDLP